MLLESAIIITINLYPSSQEIRGHIKTVGFKTSHVSLTEIQQYGACCIKIKAQQGKIFCYRNDHYRGQKSSRNTQHKSACFSWADVWFKKYTKTSKIRLCVKEPHDHKDYKPSDKWPPAATCLDPSVFITISKDYLSCCDLWVEPAAVIYCATDQWVSVCWLVMAVTLVQSSDALSANCTMSGSREPSRCSAASGSRTLERARDLFVLFCHKTQLRHYWLFGMSRLWQAENSSSARGQNRVLFNFRSIFRETSFN